MSVDCCASAVEERRSAANALRRVRCSAMGSYAIDWVCCVAVQFRRRLARRCLYLTSFDLGGRDDRKSKGRYTYPRCARLKISKARISLHGGVY